MEMIGEKPAFLVGAVGGNAAGRAVEVMRREGFVIVTKANLDLLLSLVKDADAFIPHIRDSVRNAYAAVEAEVRQIHPDEG